MDAPPPPSAPAAEDVAPGPLSDSSGALLVATDAVADYEAAAREGRAGDLCTQSAVAALSYREAGRDADGTRWQTVSDSACAALEPVLDRLAERVSDSLARVAPAAIDSAGR